jgi:protein O-mannosyl-transferase
MKLLLAWLALLPVLVLTFYPGFAAPFMLDDGSAIVANSDIREISVGNLVRMVRGHANIRGVDHHPVSAFTLMLDYQWAGLDPYLYHFSNLLYHWVVAGLVMLLVVAVRGPGSEWVGITVMGLWAVHPLATMPVAYITGRQEALLVGFYVGALVLFVRGREWACVVAAVAAFLCKEVAVTLPGAIWLVDWAMGGGGIVETFRKRWRFYLVLTSVWLLLCAYHLRGGRNSELGTTGLPLGDRVEYLKAQAKVVAGYAGKFFWPANHELYPYVWPAESLAEWAPFAVLIGLYLVGCVVALRWSRWLAVTLVFPLLVLLPTSSVIPLPFEPAMEYRFYLPTVAWVALLVVGLYRVAPWPAVRVGVPAVVMVVLAVLSHVRCRDYESVTRLYEQDLKVNPRSLNALHALAYEYRAKGLLEKAEELATRQIDLGVVARNRDAQQKGYTALAAVNVAQHRDEEAKANYRRVLQMGGNMAAQIELAAIHVRLNEFDEAEPLLQAHLRVAPDSADALLLLYESRISTKRFDEAERYLQQAMRLYPEREDLVMQKARLDRARNR